MFLERAFRTYRVGWGRGHQHGFGASVGNKVNRSRPILSADEISEGTVVQWSSGSELRKKHLKDLQGVFVTLQSRIRNISLNYIY